MHNRGKEQVKEKTTKEHGTDLCEIPLLVAKRTDTSRLEPTLDAIQMKNVSTVTKGNAQAIVVRGRGISLVFNRGLVEGISTNGALGEKKIEMVEGGGERE
jgi:hypothetical protein